MPRARSNAAYARPPWIAAPPTRELRELVRYRAKLVALRSGLKAQVHAVLAKQGIIPTLDDICGPGGQRFLDDVPLDKAYAIRVESLRDLIEIYDREIAMLEPEIHRWLRDDAGTAYYYAHLSSIASGLRPGSRVSLGQRIGAVGRTGDARGGVHHLHFELHPPGRGPINPYAELRAVDTAGTPV